MLTTFVITLAFLHISNAEHTFSSRISRYPNKRLILAEPSFDNTTLYYATCDQPPKQCTVVREINPFTKGPEINKCKVDLKADDVQLVVAFGEDKAILLTKESSMLKTSTVHMSSCETVDTELFEIPPEWKDLQLHRKFLDVVVFDGGFELVIKEFAQICNEPLKNIYCAFSFDNEGKRNGEPYVWPKIMFDDINVVSSILPGASGRGYVFIHKNTPEKVFFPANDSSALVGIQTSRRMVGSTFVKLWGPERTSSNLYIGGHSTANNLSGACFVLNSTVQCQQNNARGGFKMETIFPFNKTQDIWNISIQNLPGGGFIILMITCPNRVCSGVDDHYYFMKIDAQAIKMGQEEINLKKSRCSTNNGDISTETFINEQGLYCSAILCNNKHEGEAQLEIRSDCYSDKDFSKYITLKTFTL